MAVDEFHWSSAPPTDLHDWSCLCIFASCQKRACLFTYAAVVTWKSRTSLPPWMRLFVVTTLLSVADTHTHNVLLDRHRTNCFNWQASSNWRQQTGGRYFYSHDLLYCFSLFWHKWQLHLLCARSRFHRPLRVLGCFPAILLLHTKSTLKLYPQFNDMSLCVCLYDMWCSVWIHLLE